MSAFWSGDGQESGLRAICSSDVWKCLCRLKKAKSSPDGVTAEMLLALLEKQNLCLASNIQDMFSSLNFQETWFRVMASLIPKKHIREASASSVPSDA